MTTPRNGGRSGARFVGAGAAGLLLCAGTLLTANPASATGSVGALPCADGWTATTPSEQLECLQALAQEEAVDPLHLRQVLGLLEGSDSSTDHLVVAAGLDVIRGAGSAALAELDDSGTPTVEILSGLLPYRSPLYQDRDKAHVVRLRAYVLITLTEIGLPPSALPTLVDSLAHIDETMPVLELAAATRAVRSLGDEGRPFIPFLLDALTVRSGAHEVSLERYEPDYPRAEATTVQIEAVRSLGRVTTVEDQDVVAALSEVVRNASGYHEARVVEEARQALDEIRTRQATVSRDQPLASAHPAPPTGRPKSLDIAYTDHDGRKGILADLVDRPTLLTFFYTRCQNGKKCPMTIARLAALQRGIAEAGLGDRVRILAATYEPQLDTPERIERHTSARGLKLGDGARALQLDADRQPELLDELGIEVSYNAGWVNAHGVRLTLLGAGGEIVGAYRDLAWHTETVLEDLRGQLGGDGQASPAP